MIGVVSAALLGLFGIGPLSETRAGGPPDALELEYERYIRHGQPFDVLVRFHPGALTGGKARLWVNRAYLRPLLTERIIPEPEVIQLHSDRVTFQFDASGDGVTEVRFRFIPTGYWTNRGQIGLPTQPPVTFSQFIYP